MNRASLAFGLFAVLAHTGASAQTATPPAAMPAYLAQQAPGNFLASDYMEETVYGPADQSIGEINDLVIDPASGQVTAVVLGVGGFLGMGEKNVAVPFNAVKIAMRDGKSWLSISATKEELKSAPNFVANTKVAEPTAVKTSPGAKPVAPDMAAKPAPAAVAPDMAKTAPAVAPDMTKTAPAAKPAPVAADSAANAPLPGANSFTEAQARTRLESMGYSSVGTLAKDAQSIWRGAATKDGKNVTVAVDYKGNVTAQ